MDAARWLAQVDEEILEPELPICDAHHHLWDRTGGGQRYLFDELLADLQSGHDVRSTVYVDCRAMYRADGPAAMRPVGETEFAQGVAAMSASGLYGPLRAAAAIVGHVDMLEGDAVRPVLEAHLAASPNRFRGIRHTAGWDASPDVRNSHTDPPRGLLGEPRFRDAFRHLAGLGLSFDAWLYHPQIPDVTALARAFPAATIVLDHFGGPLGIGPYADRREAVFRAWKAAIEALATCPNVVVKIGGLQMPINGFGWHQRAKPPGSAELADAIAPYTLAAIDAFGPERAMFESNFPVDKVSCSYKVLWNAFKRVVAGFSEDEKRALFHDTAARVYRIASAAA